LHRYLKQFLSDPRVVEVPRLLWWLILNGVILRIRPRRSAKAYATVFTDQGSPLLFNTQAQTDAAAGTATTALPDALADWLQSSSSVRRSLDALLSSTK
jgi:ferrochelatase